MHLHPECPRCGPITATREDTCWYCGQLTTTHHYTSTACIHGHHDYCASNNGGNAIGQTWDKTPAACKFCDAPCTCHCHTHGETVGT